MRRPSLPQLVAQHSQVEQECIGDPNLRPVLPSNGRLRHELHEDPEELLHTPGDDGESAQEFAHHAVCKSMKLSAI